jgi:hypothetical protein
MDVLWKYYGVDSLGTGLTLVSLWLLGNRRRSGFVYGLVSNLAWGSFGVMSDSVATVFANAVCFLLNLRGYLRWDHAAVIPPPAR